MTNQSAKNFYRAVRLFAERTKRWQMANVYEVKPDERFDITLVAERVYGDRNETLAVMAAAGMDSVNQPLSQKTLVLPTSSQLAAIKRNTGFVSG